MAQKWDVHFILPEGKEKLSDQQEVNKVDDAKLEEIYKSFVEDLILRDYLEARIDSVIKDTAKWLVIAYVHTGPQYAFNEIKLDSTSEAFLEELKLKPAQSAQEYIYIRDKIGEYYTKLGYPFTKVRLEGGKIENGVVSGELKINTGPQITVDSIIIHGDVNIRRSFLENYLGIYQGEIYDHSKLLEATSQLDKLTFLDQSQEPGMSFFYDYVSLNLYLKKRNSSRFDFIFGIIPTNAVEGQQLFLSLDMTVEMLNKMGYGEYLFVDFERLRPDQQKFEIQFNYPYILDLPLAFDADFKFFRNSLDFQTVNSDLGFQYLINSTDYLKMGWDYESSRLVDVDTTAVKNTMQLPIDLDVSYNGLALEAFFSRLDYRFNPRNGYQLRIRAVGGQKTILRNTSILALSTDEFDYNSLYDSIDLSSPRYELALDYSLFRPIAQRAALGAHFKGAWRYSEEGLNRNEKFQIGGNKLLRGFDEASIFTSYYAIATLEYRLLLSNNSYFSLPFIDFGFIETEVDELSTSTFVTGIGGSLGFETKVGLFNFSIAIGRTNEIPFDLGRPKAHFGFVSLF